MQRHLMSKHRNAGLTPFQTCSSNVFTEMSAVSLRASFHLQDYQNDQVRKHCLGSISIIIIYSQWQPAYTEMLVAMPHFEFVKGIPTALEQDSYFDVNKRNVIAFDDQMIDASKKQANCEPLY